MKISNVQYFAGLTFCYSICLVPDHAYCFVTSLVVLDIGSGTAIPTCRLTAEQVARQRRAPLLRVNPREADMPASLAEAGGDSIRPLQRGALEALEAIDVELEKRSLAVVGS